MTITYKFLIIAFTAFLLSTQCFAQVETVDKSQARLIDEFGNINSSYMKAKLDAFSAEIQSEPSAKGFIIAYRSQTDNAGKPVRTLKFCEKYLTYNRAIDKERLVFIEGGEAENTVTEFWIVPIGTTPKIRQDAYKKVLDDIEFARKYDDYYLPLEYEDDDESFYNVASLETFAALIKMEKNATAYVIVYSELKDRKNTVAKMSQNVRRDLTKKYDLPLSKLKIVNGGFRRQRSVELWILPRGEHAPVATPNVFPKIRRKTRKRI